MLSLCTHTGSQSLSPLADSRVNDGLLQTMPDINEALLQLIDVVHTTFVDPLLHDSPDLVIDRVQVWTVGRPEVRTDEVVICNLRLKCMIFNVRQFPKVRQLHQIGEGKNETTLRWLLI